MAGLLACALIFSCVGVKTKAATQITWKPNTTASSLLKNKKKVLFIGNSITYFNNTPLLFERMVGNGYVVNYITCGGQSLYNHGEWIHKVLNSGGVYTNFKKYADKEKAVLFKKSGSSNSKYYKDNKDYEKKVKEWYNWYASALFQNYTNELNKKKLSKISYDYIILQDKTGNLADISNYNKYLKNKNASSSRDCYRDTWMGGLCRVVYELRYHNVTNGRTQYVINSVYSPRKNKKLSETEALQTKIDAQAGIIKKVLAEGFNVPQNKVYAMGKSDVKVAYTGDVILSYLHRKNKNMKWTAGNVSDIIQDGEEALKHPKLAASFMQAATIYKTIFGKKNSLSNYLIQKVIPAFNLATCTKGHIPSEKDKKNNEYTFLQSKKIVLLKEHVNKYGTTPATPWK